MKAKSLFKTIFPALIVFFALFMLADIPAMIITIMSNGTIPIQGNIKTVMLSGIALFLYIIGFLGLYFWTRQDFKHYTKLFWIGTAFFFTATLGIQILWNFGNS